MNLKLRRYSCVVAYTPSINKEKVEEQMQVFEELINSFGGKIEEAVYIGLKPLAYAILKNNSAHYVQYFFSLLEDKINLKQNIAMLNKKLDPNLNVNIIRFLLMKMNDSEIKVSSFLQYEGFKHKIKV